MFLYSLSFLFLLIDIKSIKENKTSLLKHRKKFSKCYITFYSFKSSHIKSNNAYILRHNLSCIYNVTDFINFAIIISILQNNHTQAAAY